MARHTPGPWIAGWSGDPDTQGADKAGPINVVSVGRGAVAECRPIPSGHASTWEVVEANARLIAKAPEMLDLLRECVRPFRPAVVHDTIRALLAEIDGTE